MNSNSIFTRRHAGADAAASVSAPATTSAAAEDAFKNDPTATLEGVRGKDVTKAAKALLKDSVKRGGGSIQMRDVVKIYPGSTVHALDDFNLDIKPGEMVVLLGGSGCGKSTALRSLAGRIARAQQSRDFIQLSRGKTDLSLGQAAVVETHLERRSFAGRHRGHLRPCRDRQPAGQHSARQPPKDHAPAPLPAAPEKCVSRSSG